MPGNPAASLTRLGRKSVKLLRLLDTPRYRRALRRGVGAAIEHESVLAALEVDFVVDVGANKGQFSLVARQRWPGAEIHAFEPLDGAADRFEAVFADDGRIHLHRTAIGEASRSAVLHLSRRADSSSLLPVGELQQQVFPGTEETGTSTVTMTRLDEILSRDQLGGAALLKIDVQGYELQVLRGSETLLDAFRYVYVECSSLELYQGQALAEEVMEHLKDNGFRLLGAHNQVGRSDGTLIQADHLFERVTANAR